MTQTAFSSAAIETLVARFLAREIPREEWTHRAHVIVGTWHVDRYGPEVSLARLRVAIRNLNDRHGTPNSSTSGYHETVTRAFVQLLVQLLADCPPDITLAERVARIVASPLADKDILLRFYSRDRLMSPSARAEWIEPDLAPLRLEFTQP